MSWLKLSLDARAEQLELTEQVLFELGAQAVTVLPLGDALPLEPAPGELPTAAHNRLDVLFPLALDFEVLRSALAERLPQGQLRSLDATFVGDEDWQSKALRSAVQTQFGGRLWLLPKTAPARGGASIRLDPGLAFGTGSHPTTRLCLEALAAAQLQGARVLDYGCGSGILAMAALALGASSGVAVDHDPQALVATNDNATYNGIRCVLDHGHPESAAAQASPAQTEAAQPLSSDPPTQERRAQLRICLPEQLQATEQFDVVVANILANPLVELAPVLQGALRPGGCLLLAGLLSEQAASVAAAYPQVDFAAIAPAQIEDGWRLLQGCRL